MRHPIATIAPRSDVVYDVSNLAIRGFSTLRLWLFDLEATGLDVTRDRITQVAGIPLVGGRLLHDEAFVQFVDPGPEVEISLEVQELTGITPAHLAGAPSFPQVWDGCVDAARGADLWIGQSVFEFDVPLLEAELSRHGRPIALPPILDSVVLATFLLGEPVKRWSTSALLSRFGVNTDGLRRHDALGDVNILGRILQPMLEMIRTLHDDRVVIPSERPLAIRRHPPGPPVPES